MTPRPAHPWWLEEALSSGPDEPCAPPLVGSTTADVVVVGGGYTGLWTALALCEREPGIDVALVEADVVGAGPSGRNGGFLHGYWEQLPGLVDTFGEPQALALAHAGSVAQQAITAFCHSRGEDVWLEQAGMMMVAASDAQRAKVRRAVADAQRLGVADQVKALSRAEVRRRCASSAFGPGALFIEAGTVQPARLARALRRAALDAGVRLYEGTRMQELVPAARNVVRTTLGEVVCRDVVLATNSALTGDRVGRGCLVNLSSYVALTEPIPDRLAEIGWTGGEGIRDGRMFLHYVRTTRDGRVAFGSGAGPVGYRGGDPWALSHDDETVARMTGELTQMFPELGGVRIERAWGGPIDMASDHAPVVGTRPGTRVHYGMGLCGHGVNPSWVVGQVLASLVRGSDDEWTALPVCRTAAPRLPPEPLRYLGGRGVRAALMRVERDTDAGVRPPLWARVGGELPRRLGIRVGTRR